MVGSASNGKTPRKTRQASGLANGGPDCVPESSQNSDCVSIQFTREVVDALLNEKMKANKYSFKDRCDQMMDYIKKLRLCIKWFQELEGSYLIEHEQIRSKLEFAERKGSEMVILMENKEEELNSMILNLKECYMRAQEKSVKEESHKLVAMDSLKRERDARMAAEGLQTSLREELSKVQRDHQNMSQELFSLNDTNTKLNDYNTSLRQFNSKIQTKLAQVNETLKCIEGEKSVAVKSLDTLRIHHSVIQDELTASKVLQMDTMKHKEALSNEVEGLRSGLQEVRQDRDQQLVHVVDLTKEVMKYKDGIGKTCTVLDGLTFKSNELEAKCLSQSEQIISLQEKLESAENKLQKSDISVVETKIEFEEQKKTIHDLQNHLAAADSKLVEGEKLRKKLHNTILELKGNIRVFCRVRPLLSDESAYIETKFISYPTSAETLGRAIDVSQNGQKHSFTFDRVFSPDASQEEVFVEISQLVQSALDGYRVCIFAYGQTGSGKTYTMMGKPGLVDLEGLIPRSLEQIFQLKQSLQSEGWKYEMQVSMLEIYNETIRDLLSTNRSTSIENSASGKQYTIKHDADGNTLVSDLSIIDVQSTKEVSLLLHRAAQSRSVGKTQINEESSRSHCVFTLRILGVNEGTGQHVQGVLNLIDLAGSERLSKSGSTGDRLKETQAINKSLSSLSDVIFSLAKKDDHVPFRNSKLTYLLQPCLGGDSKTLMIVNISPNCSSLGESLCSLRFAARVNACEIGIPRRQSNIGTPTRFSYA